LERRGISEELLDIELQLEKETKAVRPNNATKADENLIGFG
jgi:hypothetical protein